jgi:hypothetical protein
VTLADICPAASAELTSAIEIRRSGRFFALYERGTLLALVCYKVGAVAVKERIERLEYQLAATRQSAVEPTPSSNDSPSL